MSVKLSCDAINCVNNTAGLCSALNIHVMGREACTSSSTMCETFAQRGLKNAVSNFTNMNLIGEVKQLFTNESVEMSPNIKCEAENCIHNIYKVCNATNVQVNGSGARTSDSTECETFKPHSS